MFIFSKTVKSQIQFLTKITATVYVTGTTPNPIEIDPIVMTRRVEEERGI